MTDEDLRMLVYQHIVQLTVAGEPLTRALAQAYSAAVAVFDEEPHSANLAAARQGRHSRRTPQLPGSGVATGLAETDEDP